MERLFFDADANFIGPFICFVLYRENYHANKLIDFQMIVCKLQTKRSFPNDGDECGDMASYAQLNCGIMQRFQIV